MPQSWCTRCRGNYRSTNLSLQYPEQPLRTGLFTARSRLRFSQPTDTFTKGLDAGYNIKLTMSPGRMPVLKGAEQRLESYVKELQDNRTAGVSLSIPVIRGVLITMLLEDGHEDKLSPHLLSAPGMLCHLYMSLQCAEETDQLCNAHSLPCVQVTRQHLWHMTPKRSAVPTSGCASCCASNVGIHGEFPTKLGRSCRMSGPLCSQTLCSVSLSRPSRAKSQRIVYSWQMKHFCSTVLTASTMHWHLFDSCDAWFCAVYIDFFVLAPTYMQPIVTMP